MEIKIKETGEHKELNITWRRNGVNWTQDLIGNSGAMSDGQFTWSDEDDAYVATQDTYDWWDKYIADTESTEADVEALAVKLGIDADIIWERIGKYQDGDYETHRAKAGRAMGEIEEEYTTS